MKIKVRKVVNKMINITTFNDPKSPIAEAYRSIRTNIQFSRIDNEIKTIVVTSSKQDEGKTTVTSNLAVSFAALEGKRVLLIDAILEIQAFIKCLVNLMH